MLATRFESPLPTPGRRARLESRILGGSAHLGEALELRCRVAAEEVGRAAGTAGREEDWYDAHCDHLVVRDLAMDRVVATWRALPPQTAMRLGCYAADELFHLEPLEVLRDRMVEIGRFCVHPAYRDGAVERHLWTELGRYLVERGHDFILGTATIGMGDGGHAAASAHRALAEAAASPDDLRVRPRRGLPLERLRPSDSFRLPRELQGWLASGAWVCGEPAWDRAFERACLPMLLPLARMRVRALRHFLARAA